MTRYSHLATIEPKSAPLSGDFGRDYACKTFGLTPAELEKIVGRYSRGKRKGELRGEIRWLKVTRGGWHRTGPGFDGERSMGHVVKPGLRFDHAIVNPWQLDNRGQPKVLWDDGFRRWGWIPGETREQYEARQKARRVLLTTLQNRAFDRATIIARGLSLEQIAKHRARREGRGSLCTYAAVFVVPVLDAELMRRVREANARGVALT